MLGAESRVVAVSANIYQEPAFRWDPDLIPLWCNPRRTAQDILSDPQPAAASCAATQHTITPNLFMCHYFSLLADGPGQAPATAGLGRQFPQRNHPGFRAQNDRGGSTPASPQIIFSA